MTWTDSTFWGAFKDAGMLVEASVLYAGQSEPEVVDVGFIEPDSFEFAGTVSKQYRMEYQAADLPYLAEDDQVIIGAFLYKVRSDPTVDEAGGANGTFRKALLTRIGPACRA